MYFSPAPARYSSTNTRAASFSASFTLRMLVIWLPRWKCVSCRQSSMPRAFRYSSASSTSVIVSPNLER